MTDAIVSPIQVSLKSVQLSTQVIIKLMQHAHEAYPSPITGQLLGLDIEGQLEVTDSFPFASGLSDEPEQEEYQLSMMKALREVNVDHSSVGWYQSSVNDAFLSTAFIEAQFSYQSSIDASVVLVYDYVRSLSGTLSLRAFRLRAEIMAAYRANRFTLPILNVESVLEELPVHVRLSPLDALFLRSPEASAICAPRKIIASSEMAVTKSLSVLAECLDDHAAETRKFLQYLRGNSRQQPPSRRRRGDTETEDDHRPVSEPNALGILQTSTQLRDFYSYLSNLEKSTKLWKDLPLSIQTASL